MIRAEALRVLERADFIQRELSQAAGSVPDWRAGFGSTPRVYLDGRFSVAELWAILHFAPRDKP